MGQSHHTSETPSRWRAQSASADGSPPGRISLGYQFDDERQDDTAWARPGEAAWWDRNKRAEARPPSRASHPGKAHPEDAAAAAAANYAAQGPVNRLGFPKQFGEATPHEAIRLNRAMVDAKSPAEVLRVVHEHGERFDSVNVATAVNKLHKLVKRSVFEAAAKVAPNAWYRSTRGNKKRPAAAAAPTGPLGPALGKNERYHALFGLVAKHCAEFKAREVAHVLHGLTYLETEGGCGGSGAGGAGGGAGGISVGVYGQTPRGGGGRGRRGAFGGVSDIASRAGKRIDEALARGLVAAVEREAERMDPQHVALAYLALTDARSQALRRAMANRPQGWKALARAAREQAACMDAQGLSLTLSGMSKVDEARDAVGKIAWKQLCAAVSNTAGTTMEAQGIAMTMHAMGKMAEMRDHMSPRGFAKLAEGIERTAPKMTASHLAMTFNALAGLEEARDAMRPSNWVALARGLHREAPEMIPKNVATVYHGLAGPGFFFYHVLGERGERGKVV